MALAEEIVKDLADCASQGLRFEIDGNDAQVLLDYIRELESAAEDDRGVL